MRLHADGYISQIGSEKYLFETGSVRAFLKKRQDVGYASNSLVFGTCESSLINIMHSRLTLRDAIIESDFGGNEYKPEKIDTFEHLRMYFRDIFDYGHSKTSSAILRGLVLGDKTGISPQMKKQMVKTGTMHIMVASGFNVVLIGSAVVSLGAVIVGVFGSYIGALVVLTSYVFLTNFEPPIVRAYLMFCVVMTGKLLGRRTNAGRSLFWAIIFMVILDPWVVWQAGFQLSVAATYGLVSFKTILDRWISKILPERFLGLLEMDLTTTLSAFLMTLPVMIWHFGRASYLSLVSNTLVAPLVPVVTMLGFVELIISSLRIPLGGMVSIVTEVLSELIVRLLYIF